MKSSIQHRFALLATMALSVLALGAVLVSPASADYQVAVIDHELGVSCPDLGVGFTGGCLVQMQTEGVPPIEIEFWNFGQKTSGFTCDSTMDLRIDSNGQFTMDNHRFYCDLTEPCWGDPLMHGQIVALEDGALVADIDDYCHDLMYETNISQIRLGLAEMESQGEWSAEANHTKVYQHPSFDSSMYLDGQWSMVGGETIDITPSEIEIKG